MPRTKSMGRAANGNGTIRKKTVTKNGKKYIYYEARATVGYDLGTGKQIQRSVTGKTQKEVRQKLSQIVVDLDEGTYIQPSKETVGAWLDTWVDTYVVPNVKPYTADSYRSICENHVKPALGRVRLEQLTTPQIQQFYNKLQREKGLSAKTIKNVHGALHKALNQAVKIGSIRHNPADACDLPKVYQKEIAPLEQEEISRFLEAIQGHAYELLFLVTLFTGMRQGEVLGLTWDCVDFQSNTLYINKQLQKSKKVGGEYQLIPTKNGKARMITPAAFVVDALKRHKVRQTEARLKAGPLWQEEGFVFTDEVGHRLSPNTVYHNYKRLVASIGLPDARLHDLRHSYAMASLRAGDDIKTVQSNLGHHTAAFTLDIYGHVTEEMKRASAERMEKFIQGVSGT